MPTVSLSLLSIEWDSIHCISRVINPNNRVEFVDLVGNKVLSRIDGNCKRKGRFRPRYSLLFVPPVVVLFQSIMTTTTTTTHAFVLPSFRQPDLLHTTVPYCQLLGMNCAAPTDFEFSFQGFVQRGGLTDIHGDGWGLCFYQGKGVRAFHDTEAACTSPIAKFLSTSYPIQTYNMMAHIRYATRGKVDLANVHPFQREMWGIQWCFSHNGDVPMFAMENTCHQQPPPWLGDVPGEQTFRPVGETDSEAVFCALLNSLKAKFSTLPSLPVLHDTLQALCREIVNHAPSETILNFLLTCGPHVLWVYSWPGSRPGSNVWNGLHYTVREPPFQKCTLMDLDVKVDFAQQTTDKDRVAIIATKPLTLTEEWIEVKRGQLIMFDEGKPHLAAKDCIQPELSGHGLQSPHMESPKLQEDLRRFSVQRKSEFVGEGI